MFLLKPRLFAALLTFGIGVVVASLLIFSTQLPKIEVINSEIEIKYVESLSGVDSLDAIFYVTNNTAENVYYFGDHKTNNQDSLINQNGIVEFMKTHEGAEITEYELKPNESTYFWIPSPQNEKPFEASFILRIGDKRKEKVIVVEVHKQKINP